MLRIFHRLTSTLELLSEQQLSALIPPSLRYLLAIATHRRPRYLLRVLNSFDELYALLALAVERHYLITYGGGFTENFYGLKRERVLHIKGGEAHRARIGASGLMRETLQLRTRDVWNNLAIMVLLPYLKRKLDESYDIHVPQAAILGPSYNRDALPPNPTIWQRVMYYYKWFLRSGYPSLNAAYYLSLLAFNLAYLFDNTKYSSPFLWLIGTRIRRLGDADYRAIALAAAPLTPNPNQPGLGSSQQKSPINPLALASKIYPRLLSSLRILLPASIFALKFLEWWHASDFARQLSRKAIEGLDLPPPLISGLPTKPQLPAFSSSKPSNPTPNLPPTQNTVSLSSTTPKANPTFSSTPPFRPPRHQAPLSSISRLPILTVPPPSPSTSSLCPICLREIQTPTAVQTGYVFCYTCIFKWVDGRHERQTAFMEGRGGEEGWGELDEEDEGESEDEGNDKMSRREKNQSRVGKWESGKGRCAITGRRVLGGTEGLRRVMV